MAWSADSPRTEPTEMVWMRLFTVSSSSCCWCCSTVLLEETLISCCSNSPMMAVCLSIRVWSCSFSSSSIFSSTCLCSSISFTLFSRKLRRSREQVQQWASPLLCLFAQCWTAVDLKIRGIHFFAMWFDALTCFCHSACWFHLFGQLVAFPTCWLTKNFQEVYAQVELYDELPKSKSWSSSIRLWTSDTL